MQTATLVHIATNEVANGRGRIELAFGSVVEIATALCNAETISCDGNWAKRKNTTRQWLAMAVPFVTVRSCSCIS